MTSQRGLMASRLIALDAVSSLLSDAQTVALGGMLLENRPATLVRALLREQVRDLFVTSAPAGSWDVDVLVAAGRVGRMRIPHVSLGSVGLAPGVRGAAAERLVIEEVDEATLIGGYMAAAGNARLQVLDHLGRNDVLDGNALIVESGGIRGVEALRIDLALIHAPVGDESGNLCHIGSRYADLLMARSARLVVAQVDRILPRTTTARLGVSVPGYLVDAIVEAPYGAHPAGSAGAYVADLDHLHAYRAQIAAGGIDEYLSRYCDHRSTDSYIAEVGEAQLGRLSRLAA